MQTGPLMTLILLTTLGFALSGCGIIYRIGDGDPHYHGKEMQGYWDHSNMHW